MKIESIHAIEVLDSRGFPTVEVRISLADGSIGFGISPSGASTGSSEACELRDKDLTRYFGRGVKTAVLNVNETLRSVLHGVDFESQESFDHFLIKQDGSENKSNIGANAILAASLAFSDAAARSMKISYLEYIELCFLKFNSEIFKKRERRMPVPLVNILNGGKHADNNLNIQEFMIMPISEDFQQSIDIGANVFHGLKKILKKNGFNTNVGDEGGFAPEISSAEQALDLISEAVELSKYKLGKDVFFALDVAASELYSKELDRYDIDGGKLLDKFEMVDFYKNLTQAYPIFSIEDPFYEKDFFAFELLYKSLGSNLQIVGDDLFTTNSKIIKQLHNPQLANAVLIKPNQIGTLSETFETIALAYSLGYQAIISHRSGETEDTKIAQIAVGTRSTQVKFGSFSRTDRTAKYNEMLRISNYESILNTSVEFINF